MLTMRALLVVLLSAIPGFVSAQAWPARPVKVIVPFAAGSATDILGRLMSESLSKSLGQAFVVENRAGAGGIPGTEAAKNAAPDGYTLVMCTSGPFGINPAIYSRLPYDPIRDFEPIGSIALTPQAIVVGAQQPWRTLQDLVAAAKAKPGEIAFASLGVGSTSHLTIEAFQSAAGVRLNHVPFKGSGEAHTQLMGGNVPVMSDTTSAVLAHVKSGKLRALGVAIPKRSPLLPEVPTIAEQGYPGFESVGWVGLCALAKTPPEIIDRLVVELQKFMAAPATKERLTAMAAEQAGGTRAEFAAFIKAEIAKWTQVAKAAGAKAD
jgi:tripartite-type tricarboxylate transporter receptor subunit TctC